MNHHRRKSFKPFFFSFFVCSCDLICLSCLIWLVVKLELKLKKKEKSVQMVLKDRWIGLSFFV